MKKWLSPSQTATKHEVKPSALQFNFAKAQDEKTAKPDLSAILFEEMQGFKQQGLYEEALSCIQRSFEVDENNLNDAKYLYELADIYFRLKDFARSANWLQKFLDIKPQDNQGLLLKAQIFLQMNDKEASLNLVNALLAKNSDFSNSNKLLFFRELDNLIAKLAKIFKAEKLYRRNPAIAEYQKKRRQFLRQHKEIITSSAESEPKSMNKTPIELAIESIWDLQKANDNAINTLLKTPEETISKTILQQVLSFKKKLWLYNYLASIFYQHKKTTTAIYLLRQALLLDDENDLILKNLGYLLFKQNEKSAAKVTLSDVNALDFMTMDLIKQC